MRIAFDLDETLGVPLIDGESIVGWQMRLGCVGLLEYKVLTVQLEYLSCESSFSALCTS